MKYLGLPITVTRIRQVQLQFILNIIRDRLVGWKGRLMLVDCVLIVIRTFALTMLHAPKIFFKGIDKV